MKKNFLSFLISHYSGPTERVLGFIVLVTGVAYGLKWLLYDVGLSSAFSSLTFLAVALISQLALMLLCQWLRRRYGSSNHR